MIRYTEVCKDTSIPWENILRLDVSDSEGKLLTECAINSTVDNEKDFSCIALKYNGRDIFSLISRFRYINESLKIKTAWFTSMYLSDIAKITSLNILNWVTYLQCNDTFIITSNLK